MSGRRRHALAAVALALLLGFGLLEGAIRVFHLIGDDVPLPFRQVAGDEDYAPLPGASGRSILGIDHRTDALGLRGPERPLARDPGRRRVAVLGDSVVWGLGVAEEETLPAWLERLAAARGQPLEAWNLGVPANNTFNERARYARLAPSIRPDITVIVVLYNDLEPRPYRVRVTAEGRRSEPGRRAPFPDSLRPWLEKSALYHALARIRLGAASQGQLPRGIEHLSAMLGQLGEIVHVARGAGSSTVVALMPGARPDARTYDEFSAALRAFCARSELAYVDLAMALGNPIRREFLLPSDSVHPTGEGLRRAAELLLPMLSPPSPAR